MGQYFRFRFTIVNDYFTKTTLFKSIARERKSYLFELKGGAVGAAGTHLQATITLDRLLIHMSLFTILIYLQFQGIYTNLQSVVAISKGC